MPSKIKMKFMLEMSVSNRETIYSHANSFGASDYVSNSNRSAEDLVTTADNCKQIENSITFSQAGNYVKV